MTKQTFNSPIFATSPAKSDDKQINNRHPFAPLPPSFHVRSTVKIINHYHITIAPLASQEAQQQVAALRTVEDEEGCWNKLIKCFGCKP